MITVGTVYIPVHSQLTTKVLGTVLILKDFKEKKVRILRVQNLWRRKEQSKNPEQNV